jgi:hypothetical protein
VAKTIWVGMLVAMVLAQQRAGAGERTLLYAAEGAKKIIRYAADGTIAWEYPAEMSRDAWQLPNGNVLFCYNDNYDSKKNDNPSGVMEVTPDKKIVFQFQTTGQVWSCQRLADGSTLIGAASQGKLLIVNAKGEITRTIKVLNAPGHSCMRNARQIANGNFLVAEESAHAMREYNADGAMVREIKVKLPPYSAVRLENGHTIACGMKSMIEADGEGKTVWSLEDSDIPEVGVRWFAGIQVLPNGNVVVCNAGGKVPFFEVNKEKKVVWQSTPGSPTPIGHGLQCLDVLGTPQK